MLHSKEMPAGAAVKRIDSKSHVLQLLERAIAAVKNPRDDGRCAACEALECVREALRFLDED